MNVQERHVWDLKCGMLHFCGCIHFCDYYCGSFLFVHKKRNKNFEGVTKSAVVGYDETRKRVRYLCFGNVPMGSNSDNTATNTHRILKIIRDAISNTQNVGDGGWNCALSVCYYAFVLCSSSVLFCF